MVTDRNVYLSILNGKEKLQLPIPVYEIDVDYPHKNNTFESITSELNFGGNDGLSVVSFTSWFPYNNKYPFLRNSYYMGYSYVDIIRRWRRQNIPVRLIVTSSNINGSYLISDFKTNVKDATGDIEFSIVFEEQKDADVKIKQIPKPSTSTGSTTNNNNTTSNERTITANRVNFRTGASTKYKIIGKFYRGDKVKLLSQSGSWCYVDFKGKKGYVHGNYVSKSAPTSNNINATKVYKVIKRGSKGESVKECQTLLNKKGYKLAVDGSFGPAMDKAVRDFQKKNKLSVDGMCGPKTWKALTS